jgi:hypothetical protein
MYECVNGHTISERYVNIDDVDMKDIYIEIVQQSIKSYNNSINSYLKEGKDVPKYYYDYLSENEDNLEKLRNDKEVDLGEIELEDGIRYALPEKYCPICNMTHFKTDEVLSYILNKSGVSLEEIQKKIKSENKDYSEFKEKLKQ